MTAPASQINFIKTSMKMNFMPGLCLINIKEREMYKNLPQKPKPKIRDKILSTAHIINKLFPKK